MTTWRDGWILAAAVALAAPGCTETAADDDTAPAEDDDTTPADDDTGPADDDTGPADDDTADDDTADDDTADDDTTPTPDDDAAATERAFHLNLAEATVTDPPGLDALLDTYLVDYHLLMQPSDFQADSLDLLFALGADDGAGGYVQDMTFATVAVTDAGWDDPRFVLEEPIDLSIDLGGGLSVELGDAILDGFFVDAGTAVAGATLEAQIDSRDFDFMLGGEEGAVCTLLAALSIPCQPCPDDGQDFCLHLAADGITGTLLPALTLTPVPS
ncbi:hypothetical protein L6R50_16970 [Myxococcota bacterium]|nr:hypothetical protein [Myxococcota bacterium]